MPTDTSSVQEREGTRGHRLLLVGQGHDTERGGDGRGSGAAKRLDGFSLVEVVIAIAVLMLAIVPSAALLVTSNQVVATNGAAVVAANLAAGCLEQDRAVEDAAVSFPDTAGTLPVCPTGGGGASYHLTQTAGWCQESTSGTWGDYSGYVAGTDAPPAYGLLVTVAWSGHHESAGQIVTSPLTASIPASSTSCPL